MVGVYYIIVVEVVDDLVENEFLLVIVCYYDWIVCVIGWVLFVDLDEVIESLMYGWYCLDVFW